MANGNTDEAQGVARVVDPTTNAKLEVSFVRFFGKHLFWGDYCGLPNPCPNDHGAGAAPEHDTRRRHGRFPHPDPFPAGEGEKERLRRDFHGTATRRVS